MSSITLSDPMALELLWRKATIVPTHDASDLRKDANGLWIKRSAYGQQEHEYGWKLTHSTPLSLGGSDDISNLEPVHWQTHCDTFKHAPLA